MASGNVEQVIGCHIVVMPYPGRGHINPLVNFCKVLASKSDDILITFVITEEWFGFIGNDGSLPANIHFRTIPNVVPSELHRAADIAGFVEAVMTKTEAPFEQLLDQLDPPASTVIFDVFLLWMIEVGQRRNIPVVAPFWAMSATVFSFFHHFDLLLENNHFPIDPSSGRGDELIDYIPGVSPTRVADIPTPLHGSDLSLLIRILQAISVISKANYLILASVSELESQVIDALKLTIRTPILCVGPCVPYFQQSSSSSSASEVDYLQWLDKQPSESVLYISMGSFLSFSSTQMDEIAAGLRLSGVRYLWVAREETSRLKDECVGDTHTKGLIVPWCDQLRVLCHSSVGGFWSHCGWSSTMEGVFSGVPFLTMPMTIDQRTNSKMIVEDWKVGWKVMEKGEGVAERDEIAELLHWFMDLGNGRGIKMRRRAKELQEMCQQAIAQGGSSQANIGAFFRALLGRASK